MKTGKSLTQMAAELQRIAATKRDFAAPVSAIEMGQQGQIVLADGNGGKSFDLRPWAHNQMAEFTGIPRSYYDRILKEAPALLADNVNHGLVVAHNSNPKEARLIRTIDGEVRALLSPRYRILDSHDLCEAILPTLIENGLQVESCEMTERRFYLKAFSPKLEGEVAKGDVVRYGINVSTSDVGSGSLRVEPMLFRLVCLNGLIMPDSSLRKFHIGRAVAAEELREILSNEAKAKSNEAFWLAARDVVRNSLRPEVFGATLARLKDVSEHKLQNFDLNEVVELTAAQVGFTHEATKRNIVEHLAAGGDLTQWGLANAFTRAANDANDYELATELERAGGKIVDLGPSQWKVISTKAA